MPEGAPTPEELDMLLEDAFVVGDGHAVARLFGDGALLQGSGLRARGGEEIARAALTLCGRDFTYLADAVRVLQSRDTALVVGAHGITVARRENRRWRFAIALLEDHTNEGRTT